MSVFNSIPQENKRHIDYMLVQQLMIGKNGTDILLFDEELTLECLHPKE
jgi:hypothetical protein